MCIAVYTRIREKRERRDFLSSLSSLCVNLDELYIYVCIPEKRILPSGGIADEAYYIYVFSFFIQAPHALEFTFGSYIHCTLRDALISLGNGCASALPGEKFFIFKCARE